MPSIDDLTLTHEQADRLHAAIARRDSLSRPAYRARRSAELSKRELEVLQLAAEGLTRSRISERLFISHWTVQSHMKHIREKLGAHSLAYAIAIAFRRRLIE